MGLLILPTAGTLHRHLEVVDRILVVGRLEVLHHDETGVERDFRIVPEMMILAGTLEQLNRLLRIRNGDRGDAILIELVKIRVEGDQTLQPAGDLIDVGLVNRALRTHVVDEEHPLDIRHEFVESADRHFAHRRLLRQQRLLVGGEFGCQQRSGNHRNHHDNNMNNRTFFHC